MQRSRGEALVRLGRGGLEGLRQQGCCKAMLPRTDDPDPEAVFLNTAGGVTGGDRLRFGLAVGSGARATGATQTAERLYRAAEGTGAIRNELSVGAGGRLDWLPQETIVFEGSRTRRETEVAVAGDATLLMCDAVVLGRAAMGETVGAALLDDRRSVRVEGRLVHEEHLALTPDALADPGALGGARAMATLLLIGPGAADALGPLRAVLPPFAAASAWDGRLLARFLWRDAAPLRRALIRAIVALRGRPVPRVWQAETDS